MSLNDEQLKIYKARCEYLLEQNNKLRDLVDRLTLDLGLREHPLKPFEEAEDKE